jgi:DNA polymerase-3 subunit gamma/tau
LVKGLDRLAQCDSQYKASKEPRLLVELMLMQMCRSGAASGAASTAAPSAEKKSPDVTVPPPRPVAPGATVAPEVAVVAEPRAPVPPANDMAAKPSVTSQPAQADQHAYVPKRRLAGQVSIKETAAPVIETAAPALQVDNGTGMPASSKVVNVALLQQVWRDYALALKKKGRDSLHATLMANEPEVSGPGQVAFTIVNAVQENYLREEKPELLGYLRRQLGDPGLELEVRTATVVMKPRYTAMDKFKLMAEKNPALLTLRETLDLDLG